tara:strand:- start:1930 stop:2109 length:180 start_codon:yes stop_codon:yes gene_type:complete
MPFIVRKVNNKFKLYNVHKKIYTKNSFNTKESALNQGQNWMRYRKEKSKVVGNRIIKLN